MPKPEHDPLTTFLDPPPLRYTAAQKGKGRKQRIMYICLAHHSPICTGQVPSIPQPSIPPPEPTPVTQPEPIPHKTLQSQYPRFFSCAAIRRELAVRSLAQPSHHSNPNLANKFIQAVRQSSSSRSSQCATSTSPDAVLTVTTQPPLHPARPLRRTLCLFLPLVRRRPFSRDNQVQCPLVSTTIPTARQYAKQIKIIPFHPRPKASSARDLFFYFSRSHSQAGQVFDFRPSHSTS